MCVEWREYRCTDVKISKKMQNKSEDLCTWCKFNILLEIWRLVLEHFQRVKEEGSILVASVFGPNHSSGSAVLFVYFGDDAAAKDNKDDEDDKDDEDAKDAKDDEDDIDDRDDNLYEDICRSSVDGIYDLYLLVHNVSIINDDIFGRDEVTYPNHGQISGQNVIYAYVYSAP